jgi:hypothetical protein
MADPTPLVTADDVRALKGFPDATVITDDQLNDWIAQKQGEVFMLLRTRGIQTPPEDPDFKGTVKSAILHGAASTAQRVVIVGMPPDVMEAAVRVYQDEYNRLMAWFASLDDAALYALGLTVTREAETTIAAGLGVVNDLSYGCTPWYNAYPVRLL